MHVNNNGCTDIQLTFIRRSIPSDVFKSLVMSLVWLASTMATQRSLVFQLINYGEAISQERWRSTDPQVHQTASFDHLLSQLHWRGQTFFKVASLAFQCVHGAAPNYISPDLCHVADMPGRCHPRSASTTEPHREHTLKCQQSWPPESETVCLHPLSCLSRNP